MWVSNVSFNRIHGQYADVLEKVNSGHTIAEALKCMGMPRSSFYKWKPVAELKILDPERFQQFQEIYSDSVGILAACKTAIGDRRFSSRARDLRGQGKPRVRLSSDSILKCPHCELTITRSRLSDLQRHVREVHYKIKPHVCQFCEARFSRAADLKKHARRRHPGGLIGGSSKRCPHCFKLFNGNGQLNRHINAVHLKLKPFKCNFCNNSFAANHLRVKHIRRTHDRNYEDSFRS
ncbi:zinc finger protein 711-like [Bolinopsis microptera]|uniref:zinc finger protein 711-like n=1 Tax=Bolinopsis microptera TaxID=2820187 RepID=UPI00307AF982